MEHSRLIPNTSHRLFSNVDGRPYQIGHNPFPLEQKREMGVVRQTSRFYKYRVRMTSKFRTEK